MSVYEQKYQKVLDVFSVIEKFAEVSFYSIFLGGHSELMSEMIDIIAKKYAKEMNFQYGSNINIESSNSNAVVIKLKNSMMLSFDMANENIVSINHHIDEMTPLDVILFANCIRTSLAGKFLLVHYDQLACYANPLMKDSNDIWDAWDAVQCECRSVVIDISNMSIASLPYYKFRNLNECANYSIEVVRDAIENNNFELIATEKLDGSMVQMKYIGECSEYQNGVLYSTSNTLGNSDKSANNKHIETIEKLYFIPENETKYIDIAKKYHDYTLIYEMVEPEYDRHVIYYTEDKRGLFLTGARNIKTGKLATYEQMTSMANEFGIKVPELVSTSLDEVISLQKQTSNAADSEGVVVNIDGWLVKIKFDGFLALSSIYSEVGGVNGFKGICNLLYNNEIDDILPKLPENMVEYVESVVQRILNYDVKQRTVLENILSTAPNYKEDRKNFALWVNSLLVPGLWKKWLFALTVGDGVEHFWIDGNCSSPKFIKQETFEQREAELEDYLNSN